MRRTWTSKQTAPLHFSKRALHRRDNEKLALVLDIDETTLSNWDEMSSANFEFDSKAFNAWVESAQAPAIQGTLRIYNDGATAGREGVLSDGTA